MNQTAEIIQIDQENKFKPVEFELTPEAIIVMVKKYEALKLIPGDKESYQTIHKAKMICTKARTGTDRHRKELGSDAREWVKAVNSKAQELIAPLLPLEEKLKAMLSEEDQREEKIETARLHKIENLFSDLSRYVAEGQAYNLGSEAISNCIAELNNFEISAVDFEEKTEQAEAIKILGVESLERILSDRLKWEKAQAEAARVKADQEAEAKRLADEKAEFEAVQAKAAAEQKKKDDAAANLAAQEAQKTRKANEKLEADRLALEAEKAEVKALEEAAYNQVYAAMWDDAHLINFNIIHELAIEHNQEIDEILEEQRLEVILECHAEAFGMDADFDRAKEDDEAARIDQLKKDKVRVAVVVQDQKIIQRKVDYALSLLPEFENLECKTEEGNKIVADMVFGIIGALKDAEKAGVDMV